MFPVPHIRPPGGMSTMLARYAFAFDSCRELPGSGAVPA